MLQRSNQYIQTARTFFKLERPSCTRRRKITGNIRDNLGGNVIVLGIEELKDLYGPTLSQVPFSYNMKHKYSVQLMGEKRKFEDEGESDPRKQPTISRQSSSRETAVDLADERHLQLAFRRSLEKGRKAKEDRIEMEEVAADEDDL